MAGGSGGRRPGEETPIAGVWGWTRAVLICVMGFAALIAFAKLIGF